MGDSRSVESVPHSGSGVPLWRELVGTIASLALTMLGVGALEIPYTIRVAGLWGGIAILAVVCAVSLFSMNVVIEAGRIAGNARSYQEATSFALGKRVGNAVMQLTLLLTLFGVLIVMIPLVDENLEPLTRHLGAPRSARLAVVATVEALLSLPRSFGALKWTSLAGIACLFFMLFVIVRVAFGRGEWPSHVPSDGAGIGGIAQALSIQGLSFGTHINLNAAYAELSPAARQYKSFICISVVTLGLLFYVALGVAGWACFDGKPDVDILSPRNDFSPYNELADCVRVSMAFVLLLKTPLLVQPLRDIVEIAIHDASNAFCRRPRRYGSELSNPLLEAGEAADQASANADEKGQMKFYSFQNVAVTFSLLAGHF